ncbi:MAG: hypothetical protein OEU54_08785 [Gemmatimonadota bacterium]|nr:hypothetical protein [Gemmatimonadota bacterium]
MSIATAAAIAGSATLSAQQVDAGRLSVLEGGQRVAIESFRVWEAGANLNSVANIEPSGNRGGEIQVGIGLDGQQRGVQYLLQGPGGRSIEGVWTVDRIRIHDVSADGERWRELPSRGPCTVLEDGVAHHYLVLLHVLRSNPGVVDVVMPARGATAKAELVGERLSQVSIDDRPVAATRYDIRVDGGVHQVWVDDDGRLLRVLDPATGREAIRLPPR